MTFDDAVAAGKVTQDEAKEIFDSLPAVAIDELLGTWKGTEFPSGHANDGGLEASGWFGKRFTDSETVDPLLFHAGSDGEFFAADPIKIFSGQFSGKVSDARKDLETSHPAARLRLVNFRGVSTAAMVYDSLPIIDCFRKVDPDTVLGAMDARGDSGTYFFVLRRLR